jgi:hypothetical protein
MGELSRLQKLMFLYRNRFHDWRLYVGLVIWGLLWIVELLIPSHDLKHALSPIGQLILLSIETLAIALPVAWVFENLILPGVEFEVAWRGDNIPNEPNPMLLLGLTRIGIGLVYLSIAIVIEAFIRGFLLPF